MKEKDIVNDVLTMTKASMGAYETAISECSNEVLRNTLKQLRNEAEQFQYDLFKRAETLGYYQPSKSVSQEERQQIKSQLSQGNNININTKISNNQNVKGINLQGLKKDNINNNMNLK